VTKVDGVAGDIEKVSQQEAKTQEDSSCISEVLRADEQPIECEVVVVKLEVPLYLDFVKV